MAIQWSLLQPRDFVGSAYAARAQGQADRRQQGIEEAYRTYSRDADQGIKALAAYDPVAAGQLEDRQVANRQREARKTAAGMYANGDRTGARTTATQAGDFDLIAQLDKLDDRQREELTRKSTLGVQVGQALLGIKTPQEREAYIVQQAPQLKAQGLSDEEIAGIPRDDATIQARTRQSLTVAEGLAQLNADRTFNAGRDDAAWDRDYRTKAFNETVRGNRVAEGQRAQGLAIQAAGERRQAREGQIKLTEGQAKDGFSAKRLAGSANVLRGLESKSSFNPTLTTAGAWMAGTPAGAVGVGTDSRRYNAAKKEWSDAIIRLTTGAAATKDEMDSADLTYFPQYGDSPDVVRQKADARRRIERDAIARAGPGAAGMNAAPASRPSLGDIFGS